MILGFKPQFVPKILDGSKVHSIRKGNRWKAGTKIHFATGVRTKNYNQFNSGECVSTQTIIINPRASLIMIDGNGLNQYTKELLAKNDGFDSWEEFETWFDKGLTGQIIHWTNYKY